MSETLYVPATPERAVGSVRLHGIMGSFAVMRSLRRYEWCYDIEGIHDGGIRLDLGAITLAHAGMLRRHGWPHYQERSAEEAALLLPYFARPAAYACGDSFQALSQEVANARGMHSPTFADTLLASAAQEYLALIRGEREGDSNKNSVRIDDAGNIRIGLTRLRACYEPPEDPLPIIAAVHEAAPTS